MIGILEGILPYIQGLWALPWILIGFVVTWFLSRLFSEQKVNKIMKKIGLVLLFVFVPLLLFRIFLSFDFKENEIIFTVICFIVITLMYILSYIFAKVKVKKLKIKENEKKVFIKTVLVNQGRSSAFVGGAMLAIPEWRVEAAIYMSIGAIFLFAIIIYWLSYTRNKNITKKEKTSKIQALPWYLKIFPWYLLIFAFAGIFLHATKGITVDSFGKDPGVLFTFFTQITIPAALYYVGACIHPHDLKLNELKKMFSLKSEKTKDHWLWIRSIFFLTVIITPILTSITLSLFLLLDWIPSSWFAVLIINSILPITSTNMFLIPYGIDKKVTALSVTWTTLVCVPIVVALITLFRIYLA